MWRDLQMTQTILAVAGVCTGLTVIGGFFYAIHKFVKKIETIDSIKKENVVIIKTLFAVTDGLHQLGCNGPVTKARDELRDYVIRN
jgi:hypothetical protein